MRHPVATFTIIAAMLSWVLLLLWFIIRVYPKVVRLSQVDFIDFCITLVFTAAMVLAALFGIWYAFFSILHKILTSTNTFKELK